METEKLIPDDIRETALKTAMRVLESEGCECIHCWRDAIAAALHAERMAERERAAQLADQ